MASILGGSIMGATSAETNAHVLLTLRWSEAEPERGRFDAERRERWRAEVVAARKRGVEPLICLHDGALPIWQIERGGWLDPDALAAWGCYVDWAARGMAELTRCWFSFHGLLREAAWALDREAEAARRLIDAHAHTRLLLQRSPGFGGRPCEVGVIEVVGPEEIAGSDRQAAARRAALLEVLRSGRLRRPFALAGELPNGTPALDRVGLNLRLPAGGAAPGRIAAIVREAWAARCPITLIGADRIEAEAAEAAGARIDHTLTGVPVRGGLW